MLLPNPLISNRHLPPGKRNDLRAELLMLPEERSASEVAHPPQAIDD